MYIKLNILIGIFLLTINIFSQIHKYTPTNELNRIEKDGFIEKLIDYKRNVQYSITEDSTIIDPFQLDTTNYSSKYVLMGVYDLFNPGFNGNLTLGDFNNDNNTELYCTDLDTFGNLSSAKIFEYDDNNNLNFVYTYPDTQTFVVGAYDIDSKGDKEIILDSWGSRGIYVYTKNNPQSYPIELLLFFSIGSQYQVDNHTFCDADGDGLTDYIFVAPMDTAWFFIYEYDSIENNFIQKYYNDRGDRGFIVYDFDLDGKNEIIGSNIYGEILIFESIANDQYEITFELDTELFNAYQMFYTNDIDKNGYPEFWIGGDVINDSFKFICFESAGDNYYKRVTSISIRYLRAYPRGYVTAKDFNNDGVQEIFIALNQYLFILEFTGGPNEHQYDIQYYGIVKPENPLLYIECVSVYDIFDRGNQEILVSLLEGTQTNYFYKTYVYTNEIPSGIKENLNIADDYLLYPNFPNPFNPKTTIKYFVPSSDNVQIKLYDIMGREIKTLLDEYIQTGSYEIEFNASDLPSGVYFYRMVSGNYSETKKMMLLR